MAKVCQVYRPQTNDALEMRNQPLLVAAVAAPEHLHKEKIAQIKRCTLHA